MSEVLETSEKMNANQQQKPQDVVLQMVFGLWNSRIICVAAQIGVADILADGPKTAEEVAQASGAHGPSVYRLLRALAGLGLLTQDTSNRFALTPLGETLKSGAMRAIAVSLVGQEHYDAWGNLLHSVKTGEIAFDAHFKMPVWKFFEQNPENARFFNDAMTGFTSVVEPTVLKAYDFSGSRRIVDIGGGHGSLLAAVLKSNPEVSGVLYDAQRVIEGARARFEREGLAGRCEAIAGDFFDSVPEGYDTYMMKHIIHDWDDERALTILKNCQRAMKEGGKLLVIETVIPKGGEPSFSKMMDINMLVMTGGLERTADEFASLFERAGFGLTNVIPTESPVSIVEAVRV